MTLRSNLIYENPLCCSKILLKLRSCLHLSRRILLPAHCAACWTCSRHFLGPKDKVFDWVWLEDIEFLCLGTTMRGLVLQPESYNASLDERGEFNLVHPYDPWANQYFDDNPIRFGFHLKIVPYFCWIISKLVETSHLKDPWFGPLLVLSSFQEKCRVQLCPLLQDLHQQA